MNEEKAYLKHLAGLAAFMAWCRRWAQMPNGITIGNQTASLGPVVVQRFGVAWPKKKRFGDRPSLLYQATEGQWMENVHWSRAVLQIQDGQYAIILISKLVLGDESKFMNLPVFALRIPIAKEQGEKWESLRPSSLPIRMLWVEEDQAHVANPLVALPLTIAPATESLFLPHEESSGLAFHEMLERRLMQTGVEANPGFKAGQHGPVKVDDPYLNQQAAYRDTLKSGNDIANP